MFCLCCCYCLDQILNILIYFCYCISHREHSTVKGELIPYLVKKQFSTSKKKKKEEDELNSMDIVQESEHNGG